MKIDGEKRGKKENFLGSWVKLLKRVRGEVHIIFVKEMTPGRAHPWKRIYGCIVDTFRYFV